MDSFLSPTNHIKATTLGMNTETIDSSMTPELYIISGFITTYAKSPWEKGNIRPAEKTLGLLS